MKALNFALAVLILVIPSSAAFAADETVSVASLLKQESDFSTLPMHRNWRTNLASSHDPTGGNKDAQQFLSMQGDTAVLADLKGPGAVVRIWTTAVYKKKDGGLTSEPSGQIKIYLDDNPKPIIDEPFADLFDKTAPFLAPLTAKYGPATISYLPIPYAKHCVITLDRPQEQFYQIASLAFPEGTKVRPFSLPLTPEDEAALTEASKVWVEASTVHPPTPLNIMSKSLPAGKMQEFNVPPGPEVAHHLSLLTSANNTQLRNLILRAWFDDHKTPDIEAPAADFFGNAYGHKVFNSLFLAQDGNGMMSCYFPMPYAKTARFSLENRNPEAINVSFGAACDPAPFKPGTEYFHADFNQEITVSGRAHPWLKVAHDAGHFVGVVQTMQGNRTLGYCEGDGQIRVDEETWGASKVPTTVVGPWNGTGTEDDFNSAWYFGDGIISRPMNGCLVREDMGRINCFRFFINDAPVFQQSIDAQLEIGGLNDGDGIYYSSVAFWYGAGERVPMAPLPDAAALVFPPEKFSDRDPKVTILEGESLLTGAKTTGGTTEKQTMTGYLDAWSDDNQLAWTDAKKDDVLTLTFNAPVAGEYDLNTYLGLGPDYGTVTFAINGKPMTGNMDNYRPELGNTRRGFGTYDLTAGPNQLTVTQLHPNGASKGTRFGLDVLVLRLLKPATPPPAKP